MVLRSVIPRNMDSPRNVFGQSTAFDQAIAKATGGTGRYRGDRTTNFPLLGGDLADPRPFCLHQSIRSHAAFRWGRSYRRRKWSRNRRRGCRWSRCGPRCCCWGSSGSCHRPSDNSAATLLPQLQPPTIRLLQSPTLRELQRAQTAHCDCRFDKRARGVLNGKAAFSSPSRPGRCYLRRMANTKEGT